MKRTDSRQLIAREKKRNRKWWMQVSILLLLADLVFASGWILASSFRAYNEQAALSVGDYDFTIVSENVPEQTEFGVLKTTSSLEQAAYNGNTITVDWNEDPALLYPNLLEGAYPDENELLITKAASVFYDLHPGDSVEIISENETFPKTISGVAAGNYSAFIIPEKTPWVNAVCTGYYQKFPDVSYETLEEHANSLGINYQKQAYLQNDLTHRLQISGVLRVFSTLFLPAILLCTDILYLKKHQKNNRALLQTGMSQKQVNTMSARALFFHQLPLLLIGYAAACLLWKLSLDLTANQIRLDGFNTLSLAIPYSLPYGDLLLSLGLLLSSVLLCFPAAKALAGLPRHRKKRRNGIQKRSSLFIRPWKQSPAIWLIVLTLLIAQSGMICLSALMQLSSVDTSSVNSYPYSVSATLVFDDWRVLDNLLHAANADEQDPSMRGSASPGIEFALQKVTFDENEKTGTIDTVPSVILDDALFNQLFGQSQNSIVLVSADLSSEEVPDEAQIRFFPVQASETVSSETPLWQNLITRSVPIVKADPPKELPAWLFIPEPCLLMKASQLSEILPEGIAVQVALYLFSQGESSDRFFDAACSLLKSFQTSGFSFSNSRVVEENLVNVSRVIRGLLALDLIILAVCSLLSVLLLFSLFFGEEKQSLKKLIRAGLTPHALRNGLRLQTGLTLFASWLPGAFCFLFFGSNAFSLPKDAMIFCFWGLPLLYCLLLGVILAVQIRRFAKSLYLH